MFDDSISAELPEHEDWIHSHAISLLKSRYGINTAVVQSERTYCQHFYMMFTERAGREVQGLNYGFPLRHRSWCNSVLKRGPINKWQNAVGKHKAIVGIAADEPKRITRAITKGQILPLVDYGITEAEAFDICRRAGFLSPAYNKGRERLGCWFCHNQRINEMRRLRHEYPELWNRLVTMEDDSRWKFKQGKTLEQFDRRFAREDMQMVLPFGEEAEDAS